MESTRNDNVSVIPNATFTKNWLKLAGFRENNAYIDVNITVCGKTYPCHRVVLASVSEYFASKFRSNVGSDIEISTLKPDCFEKVLEFIYTGRLNVDQDNAYDLLVTSNYLAVEEMTERCAKFLQHNLSSERVIDVCIFAQCLNTEALYHAAAQFIAMNFATLSRTEDFLKLPHKIFETILMYRASPLIDDTVMDAIIRWARRTDAGENTVKKLLKWVKSEEMTEDYLIKLVMTCKNSEKSNAISHVVGAGKCELKIRAYCYAISEYFEISYRSIGPSLYSYGIKREDECGTYQRRSTVTRDRIFSLGYHGSDPGSIQEVSNSFDVKLSEEECEDLEWHPTMPVKFLEFLPKDKYRTLRDAPIAVKDYALVGLGDTIYLYAKEQSIGEVADDYLKTSNHDSKSIFAYIYDLDRWIGVPEPKIDTFNSSIAVMNNFIILIGGKVRHENCASAVGYVQMHDPRMPDWISLPNMSFDHVGGAAASQLKHLYVAGGECDLLEVYDAVAGRWCFGTPMLGVRSSHNLVSYASKLWLTGVDVDSSVMVESYDPVSGEWSVMEEKKIKEIIPGVVNYVDAFIY